jgi:hypothetical protein
MDPELRQTGLCAMVQMLGPNFAGCDRCSTVRYCNEDKSLSLSLLFFPLAHTWPTGS